jgi:hypothetical protein
MKTEFMAVERLICLFTLALVTDIALAASAVEYTTTKMTFSQRPYSWIWCDDTRLLGHRSPGSPNLVEWKLVLLDVKKPSAPAEIDIKNFTQENSALTRASCRGEKISFVVSTEISKALHKLKLYVMKPTSSPELILEIEDGRHSIAGFNDNAKYLILRSEVVQKGSRVGTKECKVKYLKPGYRVLCWDSLDRQYWPLEKFVISKNSWTSKVWLIGKEGKPVFSDNPKPPLLDDSGKVVHGWYELHDLSKQSNLSLHSARYITQIGLTIAPDEKYAYTACGLRSNKIFIEKTKTETTLVDRVCRYPLDGIKHEWEEVFAIPQRGHKLPPSMAEDLSASRYGDLIFKDYRFPGTWLYSAKDSTTQRITRDEVISHSISPDGRYIAINPKNDPNKMYLVHLKGEKHQ